ncbi:Endonuclease/exonuclease/phosphatase [Acephala macrosclerotiorum]|nr:Endonuclease/exonuclease/phosphatase [Acephala macrosclerotiorum]
MTRNKPVSILEDIPSQSPASHASIPKEHILDIRILTHNVRYATESPFKGEERWPVRCPRLCSELVFNSIEPTTFICLQEVLHSQLVDILACLNESSSPDIRWSHIGVGRDDGKQAGEYSPVIYRPSVWNLNWSETRWLSETPEIPSKGWDASSIRLVTIGNFTHIQTGRKILVLSTHLDNDGSISRKESAKLILGGIKTFTETNNASAVLLAGDFNSPPDDGAYQIMTSPDSIMEDIGINVPKEKRHGNEMTFTSFGYVDNEPSRIDFIFSRKGDKVTYRTYAVLANRFDDGVYLSDHRACVADIVLH